MTWLLIDTETTGVDPKTDRLIEVGAAIFDPITGCISETRSWLRHAESNPAQAINRIPSDLVDRCGIFDEHHAKELFALADRKCEFVLAHSAAFDRQWLPELEGERWICTYEDAEWPRVPSGTGSLTTIALAYDVGVVRAHRAIEDCLTLAAVLGRVHEIEGGLKAWIARALEPRIEVRALVSYDDREKAKQAGFRWDAGRRLWVRSVRESQLGTLTASLAFETRRVA